MKNRLLVICSLLMSTNSHAQICQCNRNDTKIEFKNKVIICGVPQKAKTGEGILLSEMVVRDCIRDKYLMDYRQDAVHTFAVKKFKDSVTITDMLLVPTASMQDLDYTPLSYQALWINPHGEARLSKERFVFKAPALNDVQRRYLDKLCAQLKEETRLPQTPYPFDEASVYALFLGAVNNYNDCYNLFLNLDKYYKLDGAIAETKGEIPFEYITNRIK